MKNLFLLLILFCVGCSHKHQEQESASWKELDSVHDIMAKVFHPLQDSGNLAPAKKFASDLADQTASLASSSLPEKVNTPDVKSLLEKIKLESRSLADTIKNGAADEVVKSMMTSLHTQFHEIVEKWSDRKEGEHKGKHHDDGDGDEDEDEDEDDD